MPFFTYLACPLQEQTDIGHLGYGYWNHLACSSCLLPPLSVFPPSCSFLCYLYKRGIPAADIGDGAWFQAINQPICIQFSADARPSLSLIYVLAEQDTVLKFLVQIVWHEAHPQSQFEKINSGHLVILLLLFSEVIANHVGCWRMPLVHLCKCFLEKRKNV